jgi:hypothetical protein
VTIVETDVIEMRAEWHHLINDPSIADALLDRLRDPTALSTDDSVRILLRSVRDNVPSAILNHELFVKEGVTQAR